MKKLNAAGFHLVGIAFLLLVLSVIGFAGYKVLHKKTPAVVQSTVRDTSGVEPSGLNTKLKMECLPRGHDNYRSNNTLAIDPANEDVMYIAVELKGVFKSTDGGRTWRQSDYGIRGYAMESDPTKKCVQEFGRLVINGSDSQHLLLSRVESPGTDDMRVSENAGLWESKDAGATWHQLIKPGMNMSGSKAIAIAPNDPKVMYYGINNGRPSYLRPEEPYAGYNKTGVLHVTRDGGKTWRELPTGVLHGLRAMGVYVDKNNPDKLWLFTMTQKEDGSGTAPPSEQRGAMLSQDGGRTWQSFAHKLPESTRAVMFGAMNPRDSSSAYVTAHTHAGPQASFVTQDNGATWQQANRSMYFVSYDPHDAGGRRLLGYDPFQNPAGLYESTDKGLTWRYFSALPAGVDNSDQFGVRIESIVFAPRTKGVVYMSGSKGNIWKSVDQGRTWQTLMTIDSIGGPNKDAAGNTKSREAHR